MEDRMKYDVTIKGTLTSEDDVEVDKNDLINELIEAIDNADVEITTDELDEDDQEIEVSYNLSITDAEVNEAKE